MFRNREGALGPRRIIEENFYAEIPHGDRGEVLRVAVIDFGGGRERKIDFRQWAPFGDNGKLCPSHFGCRVPLTAVITIAEALQKIAALEGGSADEFIQEN